MLSAAPLHIKLPVALMMFTGMDPQDALHLPRAAIRDGRISVTRGKTGAPVLIPIVAELLAILGEVRLPDVGPVCLTSRGKPWTAGGFNASWRKLRLRLEAEALVQPGLTPKGLRHTVATILAETEGVDTEDIAAVLGNTPQMAKHYSRRADRSRRVEGAVARFDAEANRRRTESVKPT